ncbi:hypothetical protein Ocin01_00272 [Orchesella cincta]|uniref:Protein sleepless n=1 Tax=Orchesella cincta TaxID=48709 RepID=A0A1D2NMT4_ORCCI|nr:hypothetical protein Ocin01_00272 [Orchesella cincta]
MMSTDDEQIIPYKPCTYIHEGQFCVKAVGIIGGSLGTRRFCSSRDLGNYCEYIRRPGDQREYRSCVYTCTGDGCNGAGGPYLPNLWVFLTASVLSLFVYFRDFSSSSSDQVFRS